MRKSSSSLALTLLLAATVAACTASVEGAGDETSARAAIARAAPLNYLTDDAIDLSQAVAPPPVLGSPEEQRDLDQVLEAEATRTAEDCARAAATDVPPAMTFTLKSGFGAPYGPLTDAEVAAWAPFFDKVRSDVKYFIQKAQAQYNRKRPSQVSTAVHPCITLSTTPAYPSGHAVASYVVQGILAQIDPSRSEAFAARAEQIARDRLLTGVHYPTDLVAGRKLGVVELEALMNSARFQADFAAIPRP